MVNEENVPPPYTVELPRKHRTKPVSHKPPKRPPTGNCINVYKSLTAEKARDICKNNLPIELEAIVDRKNGTSLVCPFCTYQIGNNTKYPLYRDGEILSCSCTSKTDDCKGESTSKYVFKKSKKMKQDSEGQGLHYHLFELESSAKPPTTEVLPLVHAVPIQPVSVSVDYDYGPVIDVIAEILPSESKGGSTIDRDSSREGNGVDSQFEDCPGQVLTEWTGVPKINRESSSEGDGVTFLCAFCQHVIGSGTLYKASSSDERTTMYDCTCMSDNREFSYEGHVFHNEIKYDESNKVYSVRAVRETIAQDIQMSEEADVIPANTLSDNRVEDNLDVDESSIWDFF